MDENLYKPLTLVSAGAGYGKSMLISSWLEKYTYPNTWISLSADDSDLKIFLEYLEAGIKLTLPDAIENFSKTIKAAELPSVKIIAEILINELDEITQDFIIVFDDFHLIRDPKIHELLNIFLKFPPQHIHLVIITRRDPLLDLNNIRAHSRMNEIRMSDLSFNQEEIGQLFKNPIDINLNSKTIRGLHTKTEGWITGLRLTSLLMKDSDNVERVLGNLSGNLHLISTYLIEEVLSQVSDEVRVNLLRTSLLNRFCTNLIDHLNDCLEEKKLEKPGQEFVDWLIKSGHFIISLDNENKWFRYHHLFQDLLKAQLQKYQSCDRINSIHLCAANWFDKNDFCEEAVRHAIKANDYHLAVDFVTKNRQKMMVDGEVYRLNKLIDLLPKHIIETSPALLISKSFIMEYKAQVNEMISFKEKAKAQLNEDQINAEELKIIKGEIATIEAELYLYVGDGKNGFDSSRMALELLPVGMGYARPFAVGAQIICSQLLNNVEKIDQIIVENPSKSIFGRTLILAWSASAFAMEGSTQRLKNDGQKLIDISKENQNHTAVVFGKYFLSASLYLTMQDHKAEPFLSSVVSNPLTARPYFVANFAYMLSSIYLDKGEAENAYLCLDNIILHTEDFQDKLVSSMAKAMRVDLALKEQNMEKALLFNEQQESYEFYPPIWFIHVPQLTPIKLKLAINTTESIEEAIQMLSDIEGLLQQSNKKTILIDVHILQAIAFMAKKNEKDALSKLNEAVSLSYHGNCIRTFVDYGDRLKALLNKSLSTSGYSAHVQKILEAITNRKNSNNKITKNKHDKRPEKISTDATFEMLSFREVEILKLVAEGLKNKEIAEKLFLSDGTIKKHVYNIAQKLETTSRIGSVKKAEELRLI